jgi:REP element-mobilizing transposase RayT
MSFHFKPLNWAGSVEKRERHLQHWDQAGCTYFVTWRLADSVDAVTLQTWKRERDEFFLLHPKPWDESIEKSYHDRFTRRMERWLDSGHGSCVLRERRCRDIVIECLNHFAGIRYELAAWVIMPNHVHVLVCPRPGWQLVRILHTWKSFTASKINEMLGLRGMFWMDESFDHIVRDKSSLERFAKYICNNPIKAGLRDDEYSLWDGLGA